jgi:glucose dehydrogenase
MGTQVSGCVVMLGSMLLAACGKSAAEQSERQRSQTAALPSGARIPDFVSRDYRRSLMPAGDYAATRYGELDQITTANVSQPRLAWTPSTGELRGHEAAPLVVGDTMYLVTPFPNNLLAYELTASPPQLKWKFEPISDPAAAQRESERMQKPHGPHE